MANDDIQKRNSDYIKNLGNNLEFYLHYLTTMAKFHKYSAEDLASLAIEAPQNFSAVASPEVWKKHFHRSIGKNAKGINIMRDGKKVTVYDVSETLPPDKISLWEYNDDLHKRFLDSVIQNDSNTPEKIQKIAENLIAQTELNDSDKKFATLSTSIVILERLNQSQNNSEEFRKPIENFRRQLANLNFDGRNYKILTDTIQKNSQKVLDAFQKSVQVFSDDIMDLEYNFPDLSLPENNPLLKTLGIIEVAETQQAAEEKNSDVEIKLNIGQENLFSGVQKETGTDLIEDLLKDATIEPVTYKNENGEIYHVHYPDGFSVIYEGTDYKKGAYKEGFGRTEKSFKTFNEAFRYVQNHKNDTDKEFLQNDNFDCYYKITKNIPDKLTLNPALYVYNFKTHEEVYFDEKIKEFIQTEQKKVSEDIKNIVVPEENFIDLTEKKNIVSESQENSFQDISDYTNEFNKTFEENYEFVLDADGNFLDIKAKNADAEKSLQKVKENIFEESQSTMPENSSNPKKDNTIEQENISDTENNQQLQPEEERTQQPEIIIAEENFIGLTEKKNVVSESQETPEIVIPEIVSDDVQNVLPSSELNSTTPDDNKNFSVFFEEDEKHIHGNKLGRVGKV